MAFINPDFMLLNEVSQKLYHEVSSKQAIIDYHCHLDPKAIALDQEFADVTELWLNGDHYKWRAMRQHGVQEKYITGDASSFEKFQAWAEVLENCVGNPLYHWSALELKRYFDVEELLNGENAREIFDHCNKVIRERHYSPKTIIKMSNVEYICTTDNPTDSLEWHDAIKTDTSFKTVVAPGFRPDQAFAVGQEKFFTLIDQLKATTGIEVTDYSSFIKALYNRIDFFNSKGCTVSDHGLGNLWFVAYEEAEVDAIFADMLANKPISLCQTKKYLSRLFVDLAKKYTELNWVMQIHYGAIRNNDGAMFKALGADIGCDSMMDQGDVAVNLNAMLSAFKVNNCLPKFIIYNLEPSQNNMVACTLANFGANTHMRGKLQYGSGWWFNDTKEGMLRQLATLADQGLIMNFVGMLTDSRSFVSYCRHDYFRRILCQFIGNLVVQGEIPNDEKLLTKLIENISYKNALRYFELEK